ncbi:unnamed protein product [Thelazia callipaeda]|uniref:non-specific serine/threonine protein kinase n=1 Tax=Thelazia callipaeda TaxID=103827 RepID=A0A0N5D142_THECL|nr:unnamed protein product [Thelazia callipaeda]
MSLTTAATSSDDTWAVTIAVAPAIPPKPPRALVKIGFYEIESTIGKGSYALVKLARHRITKTEVAIKIVDKGRLNDANLDKVYREIEVLKKLNHPYIIRLYQVIETKNMLYLVTEYAPNGEIFDFIAKQNRLSEENARQKFAQIISAIDYLHNLKIVHRDLKAENLLLDAALNIKIADFGFSNFYSDDYTLDTFCGSPPYAAPEVFEGKRYIGPEIDVWSLGVILYVLICGVLPFEGSSLQLLRDRVLSGYFRIPYFMSTECENLIRKMLTLDPKKRATIEQIKKHQWMQSIHNKCKEAQFLAPSYDPVEPQHQILNLMQSLGIDSNLTLKSLKNESYDNFMAIYMLLYDRWRASLASVDTPKITRYQNEVSQNRPSLVSLRNQATFKPSDCLTTSAAYKEFKQFSRKLSSQSTIDTFSSIDEEVSNESSSSDLFTSPFESFEADALSSFSIRSPNSDDSNSSGPCGLKNSLIISIKHSSISKNNPCLKQQEAIVRGGWQASDISSFSFVHGPFPVGHLTKKTEAMQEILRLSTSLAVTQLQNLLIIPCKMELERQQHIMSTLSKRTSLPRNLEFQPQNLLNSKQSLHIQKRPSAILGTSSVNYTKNMFKIRFTQKQMKNRLQLSRKQFNRSRKNTVLPPIRIEEPVRVLLSS